MLYLAPKERVIDKNKIVEYQLYMFYNIYYLFIKIFVKKMFNLEFHSNPYAAGD